MGGGLDRNGRPHARKTDALRDERRPFLMPNNEPWREKLRRGVVIPAHPLALDANRKLDERRQRALTRYYLAAGAGGVAVGVHTTQFEIRDHGLLAPVLQLAMEELRDKQAIRIAGIVGKTAQAVKEAEQAAGLGYHAGLLSLGAMATSSIA